MKGERIILSIDPGKNKCGVALLSDIKGVIYHKVILSNNIINEINTIISGYRLYCIVLGDRTHSLQIKEKLSLIKSEKGIIFLDEHLTTELARKKYFKENPPGGWKRLIPVSLQVPPVPYDDYAAIILGERFLSGKKDN